MFFKSMAFKQSVLFLSIFAVSGGATMFMMYERNARAQVEEEESIQPPVIASTPAEKLLNSLLSYGKIGLDAKLSAWDPDSLYKAEINIDGNVDMTDIEALKLNGSLKVDAAGSTINADLTYYSERLPDETISNKMYLDYNNSHLVLDQADVLSFTDMIPSIGNIELPEELKNIDFDALTSQIFEMTPEKNGFKDVDGTYVFKLPKLVEGLNIWFSADDQFNCKGIFTEDFFFNNMYLKAKATINKLADEVVIENPEEGQYKGLYQNFKPAMHIINGVQNLFEGKQNTINLGVTVTSHPLDKEPQVVDLDADLSYDLDSGNVSLAAGINENERNHNVKMLFQDGTMFINQEEINKISLDGISIDYLLTFLSEQFSNGTIEQILNHIGELTTNPNVLKAIEGLKNNLFPNKTSEPQPQALAPETDTTAPSEPSTFDQIMGVISNIQNYNNWIKNVDVQDGQMVITLDFSELGLNGVEINITLKGNDKQFDGIDITGLTVNGTDIDLHIGKKIYNPFTVNEVEAKTYVKMDPIILLTPSILDIAANRDTFGFIIDADITDTVSNLTTTIDGGFQFDIRKATRHGMGEVTITEPNGNYPHNIKADVNENNVLLLSYNKAMNGFMKTQDLFDMGGIIADIMGGKDEGFNAAFAEVLKGLHTTPVYKAMQGDIGAIFFNDAFVLKAIETDENAKVGEGELRPLTAIVFEISGKLFGMDDTKVTIRLEASGGKITALKVVDLKMGTSTLNFSLVVDKFSEEKDKTRLTLTDGYMNLGDLKTLLQLGIKTTTFTHFTLDATLNLDINLGQTIKIPVKEYPISAAIENIRGKLRVIVNMPNVPVEIPAIPPYGKIFGTYDYSYCRSRNLWFMYQDGIVYGHKRDIVSEAFGINKHYADYDFAATEDSFIANMDYYMLDFAFGFSKELLKSIQQGQTGTSEPIHYENIVRNFIYHPKDAKNPVSRYDFDVNLFEFTHNTMIANAGLSLFADPTDTFIEKATVGARINLTKTLNIGASLNIKLLNPGVAPSFAKLDEMIQFMSDKIQSNNDRIYVYLFDEFTGNQNKDIDLTAKA